jgi:hypothetical protein
MANWKKVVVSGSAAELDSLRIANNGLVVTGSVKAGLSNSNQANIVSYDTATGQFFYQGTGSFTATTASYILSSGVDGPLGMNSIASASQALTASLALRTTGSLSQVASRGIAPFSFDGSTNVQIEVSGAAQLNNNQITKWDSTDGKFVNSSVFDNGTYVYGSTSLRFTGTETQLTGSFTGSFAGEFVGVTNLPDLTQGTGITAFTYDGGATATVAVSGASSLTTDKITKWTGDAFANTSLSDNGTVVSGASSIQLTGTNSSLTGSFTGSFKGDGSQLTGLVTTLKITGSYSTEPSTFTTVDLLNQGLTIAGTLNEINVTASAQTVTIGLPGYVEVTDLTVNNNLVVLGTASFQNTTNLEIKDRFILLASGSNTPGDGGLVVQQATQDVGELFGFDNGTQRWAVTGSFNASLSSFTPDAFMAAVVEGASGDPTTAPAKYVAKGNIFVGSDETIWIYS